MLHQFLHQELARKIQAEPQLAEVSCPYNLVCPMGITTDPIPYPQTLGLSAFMTHEKQILPPSPPYPAAPLGLLELLKDLSCKTDNLFTQHRCLLACFAQWPPLRPWSSVQPCYWNL